MGRDDDSTYVIRSGAAALDRLELIARLFWPTTAALLDRTGAWGAPRFLDVGCGIGDVACRVAARGAATGIDVNADVVHAAAARAQRLGSPADFRVGALADLGTSDDLSGFDVVFARCVVSHLPDPAAAVASMIAAARRGGTVLIEDVEVAAIWSSPPSAALARHVQLYVDAARGLGAHPEVGSDLAALLADAGATDIGVDIAQPLLRAPADLRAHALTMEAIAGPVVAQGLATADEVDDLVARLDAWAGTPGVVATLPRIIQVDARTPPAR